MGTAPDSPAITTNTQYGAFAHPTSRMLHRSEAMPRWRMTPLSPRSGFDDTGVVTGNGYLQWISLDPRCHGTARHQIGFMVVSRRADDQCRSMAGLFMTGLWVEMQPYNIVGFGNIAVHHRGSFLPAAGSKSISACRFSGVGRFPSMMTPRVVGVKVSGISKAGWGLFYHLVMGKIFPRKLCFISGYLANE